MTSIKGKGKGSRGLESYETFHDAGSVESGIYSKLFNRESIKLLRKALRANTTRGNQTVRTKVTYPIGTWKMPGCIRENVSRGSAVFGTGVKSGA